MYLMGLDVGTTGVKAAVFSEDGKLAGYGFEEYAVSCPRPGYAEQDAELVFQAALRVMEKAAFPVRGEIEAIGVSVQGDAVMPVDAGFHPVAPVQLGMDYRCRKQADAFARAFGAEAIFTRTGMAPHPLNSLCKMRNYIEETPEIDDKARYYMTYADFILARLGAGMPVIDYTMATRTMGIDLMTLDWDDSLLNAAGLDRSRLSKPVPSGIAVGMLSKDIARATGIAKGAKLVTGGHDQTCAAVGAGVVQPDLALDSHGTAEVVSSALAGVNTSKAMFRAGFPCYAHAVSGHYFTFSLNHTGGILLKWYIENFCESDVERAKARGVSPYAQVLDAAEDRPSSLLALPYLGGKCTPDWNMNAKGLIAGLRLSTTRYEVARAVLESLCFDLRENTEALRAAGVPINALRCVGGGAKSPLGLQLKADITGLSVYTLAVREAACLGAALLAGIAMGVYSNAQDAAQVVRLDTCYDPDPARVQFYQERYSLYRKLYAQNRALLDSL